MTRKITLTLSEEDYNYLLKYICQDPKACAILLFALALTSPAHMDRFYQALQEENYWLDFTEDVLAEVEQILKPPKRKKR